MSVATRQVVDVNDSRYPPALRALRKPATLHAIGNIELLDRPAVGICGSRNASDETIRMAFEFGARATELGFTVISGYAKGVDRAAHQGALSRGGSTIAVLPEGIDGFRTVGELKGLLSEDEFLAVSPFEPEAPWAAYRAMHRNQYIVALSRALVVVAAGVRGGTLDAGFECLRQNKLLIVIDYQGESSDERIGNRTLISKGGVPVRTARELTSCLQRQLHDQVRPQAVLPIN